VASAPTIGSQSAIASPPVAPRRAEDEGAVEVDGEDDVEVDGEDDVEDDGEGDGEGEGDAAGEGGRVATGAISVPGADAYAESS
jgi:hypothetical protein